MVVVAVVGVVVVILVVVVFVFVKVVMDVRQPTHGVERAQTNKVRGRGKRVKKSYLFRKLPIQLNILANKINGFPYCVFGMVLWLRW